MMACANGHEDAVKLLVTQPGRIQGIGLNARSNRGNTALGIAALQGSTTIVERLIDHGAEVDAPADGTGRTPLMIAAAAGNTRVITSLLNRRADLNARDNDQVTALLLAASGGKEAAVKLLRERGAVEDERYWFLHGYSLALDGRHADAIVDLERVRKSMTGPSVAWAIPIRGWNYTLPTPRGTLLAVLGECYQKAEQPGPASTAFREAKAAFPSHTSGVVLYRRQQRTANGQTVMTYAVQPDELALQVDAPSRTASISVFRETVRENANFGSTESVSGFNTGFIH